ncbi:MAG: quinolinate synthase NadA, partial [Kiritimatiellae bacterium]|nr:quinolinate synthase NadA [Kiritimatiellia bacterium]
ILNPAKTVLIPDPSSGCAMADMISGDELRELKAQHPGAVAVCYVNSTAEVKAECDICVTSGNAAKVMATIGRDKEILFVPDRHLGSFISGMEGREYVLWQGHCPIHNALLPERIREMRAKYPGAPVLVHPECPKAVRDVADECLSTGGMCAWARKSDAKVVLVGTEVGILHRLRKENPDKTFVAISDDLVCADMKKITLERLAESLRDMTFVVKVPEDISARAKRAIDAMLAV